MGRAKAPVDAAGAEAALKLLATQTASTYFGAEALLASVESGAIAPLRGRYLLQLHARGGRLVRRQEMPPSCRRTSLPPRACS